MTRVRQGTLKGARRQRDLPRKHVGEQARRVVFFLWIKVKDSCLLQYRNTPCGGRRRERYTVLRCVEGVRRRNPFVL